MSLIKVGIHDNMTLSAKTQINEHGTLELYIGSVQSSEAVLAAIMGNTTYQTMESNFRFYPPNMLDHEKNVKGPADIAKDLLIIRHQLSEYAMLMAPKAEVHAALGEAAMFEGIGIAPEDYAKAVVMLTQEPFMMKVYTNIVTKFLKFATEHNAFNGTILFRQKFIRQNKVKNYATISKSDFDVWVESMDVPANASAIAWTPYELKEGKNLDHPVASDKGQAKAKDVAQAATLFKTTENQPVKTTQQPELFKDAQADSESKAETIDPVAKPAASAATMFTPKED